jgi:WD40 repeat protein
VPVLSGVPMAAFHGHEDTVAGVAWSPDGGRIATASRDRTAPGVGGGDRPDALVRKARQRVLAN